MTVATSDLLEQTVAWGNNCRRLSARELEEKVNSLTEELSKTADHVELQKIAEEIEKTKTTLDEKTERWMELAEFI